MSRSIALALVLGGCALAAAPQDNARSDASNAPADGPARNADSQMIDAPTKSIDAPAVSADAPNGSGSGINGTCAHKICSTGAALQSSCSSCTTEVCSGDAYCCNTKWDTQCVDEVSSVCGDSCP